MELCTFDPRKGREWDEYLQPIDVSQDVGWQVNIPPPFHYKIPTSDIPPRNHSYTWLNSRHEPIELPAYEYITLMQRWISGKIDANAIFPTDVDGVSFAPDAASTSSSSFADDEWTGKRSGFPRDFLSICRTVFLQMFRVYAHLYWDHFLEPFYHLNLEKQLNSCFSHFILTATTLDLLKVEDLEPMKPLVDLWAADGTLPPESRAYAYADLRQGKQLMEMSGTA